MIEDDSISRAWVRALSSLLVPGVDALAPLAVTVRLNGEGSPPTVPTVGEAINEALRFRSKPLSCTTANLIFPNIWNPSRPRHELYERYLKMIPKIRTEPLNRYGVYFERLIAHGPEGAPRNQLEYIISAYASGNHRSSALQASILDPARDHTNQRRRGFPCLQQVSFLPDPVEGLTVTGYYATQDIIDRAYGNYLGLWRLGRFVAHEINVPFGRMTCVAATARLGQNCNKSWAKGLRDSALRAMAESGVEAPRCSKTGDGLE